MTFNPRRLTTARRRRGLTKRELAEKSGLGERTIVAYERSDRIPGPGAVDKLAAALKFPPRFFYRPEVERVPEEATSFRAMSRMTAAQRDRALSGAELGLELGAWIEARFSLPSTDLPDLGRQQDPEAVAMALRARWGLGDNPLSNMVWLLEAKGVSVFSLAEEFREVDAFSFWRGSRPFVFLNTFKSAERSRFDAAHELGHLVLHRHGQPNGREAEREADAFASSFLMPRSSILAFAPKVPTIERLIRAKHHWKVALSALSHRMHQVGLLSEWHYRSLVIEMQELGYRQKEPDGVPREMSQVLQKVLNTLRSDGMTRADLARELDWPLSELDALLFQLVLSSVSGGGSAPRTDIVTKGKSPDRQVSLMRSDQWKQQP